MLEHLRHQASFKKGRNRNGLLKPHLELCEQQRRALSARELRFSGPACSAPREPRALATRAGRARVSQVLLPAQSSCESSPGLRLRLAIILHMANCVISLEDLCLVIGLS